MKMNPEVKALWLQGLREEGRPQGTGYLRSNDGCCANGVLVEKAVDAGVIPPGIMTSFERADQPGTHRQYWMYGEEGTEAWIPEEVVKWAGLQDGSPEVEVMVSDLTDPQMAWPTSMPIDELNDEGKTFAELADLIEEQL